MRRGEIVGFAGLMGAGRTELAMSVFGRSYGVWQSGTIIKDGREIELKSVADAIAHGLAYVSEDRKAIGLNLLDDIKTSMVSAKLSKITRRGVLDEVARVPGRRGATARDCGSRRPPSTRASPSSPAATSRRSSWRSGCSPTRTC